MITIEVSGGGILFTFTGNQHYLYDGEIEVPVNSLSLVVDESEMFTFYKAASNDIFLSGRYSDLGMSKEQLIEFYKNNMVANGGGSSIVEIYVGTSADTVDPQTGVVDKKEGKKEWLCIVYKSEQGVYSMTKVNLNEFILEEEFASGLTSDSGTGIVHGVVDPRSEQVYTAYTSGGVPSASATVLSVNESGFTVNNIQKAIDKRAEVIEKVIEDNELVVAASLNDLEERKAEWVSAVTDGNVTKVDNTNKLSFYNRSGNTLFDIELPAAKPISGVNGVDVASGETLDVISGVVDALSEAVVISYTLEGLSASTDDVLTVGEDGFKVGNIQTAIDEAIKNARKHKVIGDESTIHGEWTNDEEKEFSSLVYVKKITSGLPETIKERYELVDANGDNIVTASGDTSASIDIPKDSHIVSITYISDSGDTHWQNLEYKYIDVSGETQTEYVDISEVIIEVEAGDGLEVQNHIIKGKIDDNSEAVITLYTSSGASAETQDVLSVGEDGFKVDNIQLGIDAKADIMRKLYHPVRADYVPSSQTINFASQINGELFDVKLSGDTELSSGSTNFVQNSAITKVIEDNEEVIAAALNDLETRKAEKLSAVTDGSVSSNTSAYTLTYKNESGDTLFQMTLPKGGGSANISAGTNISIDSVDDYDVISVSGSSAITSASTEVVTSKAIWNGLEERQKKNVELTQEEYNQLVEDDEVDPEVLYLITDAQAVNWSAGTNISIDTSESASVISVSASTAITSASTEVVTSQAIYEQLDGLKLRKITQEAYDYAEEHGLLDPMTVYIVVDDNA